MGINDDRHLSGAAELRLRAEKQLCGKSSELHTPRTDDETQRLIHELQVHQIELEMQNSELIQTRDLLEIALEKYTDLYDFAPLGYFTLDHEGTVLAVNLTASGLIGIERSQLLKCRFSQFVAEDNRQLFSAFLGMVFANQGKASCEVKLTTKNESPLYALIEAEILGAGQECRVAVIDITNRKRAEFAIQESEKRFRDIVAASADWIWEVDMDCTYVYASGRVKDVLGYEPEELVGKTPFDLMPVEEAERVKNVFQSIAQRQESFRDLANENLHKNGGIRHLLTSGVPIFDDQGLICGYRGVDKDDTERMKTEKSLFDSEARHQLATAVAKEGIWDVDFTTGTTRWNRAYDKMFNRPPDAQHHGNWWLNQIHPDDRERVNNSFSLAMTEGPGGWSDNYRMKRADGSYAYLQDRAIIVRDKAGTAIRAVGAKLDVTETKVIEEALRKSELHFRLALKNSPVSVAVQDRNLVYTWAYNQRTRQTEEIVGKTDADLFAPEDLPWILEAKRRVLESGTDEHIELWLTSNGRKMFLDLYYEPLRDSKGEINGIGITAVDLTDQKLAEQALKESEERVRMKLESILTPEGGLDHLELQDIIDVQALQSLMDDFHHVSHFPIGIIDLKGRLLVGAGWQDVCTKFHRTHPESRKCCEKSDANLTADIQPGEFRLYKCWNNMWDVATPLFVGGRRFGNIFSGQFFFEGEDVDYDLFRAQARRYGFDEEAYISALEKVPRVNRKTMNTVMGYYARLADIISKLSYSNITLARILNERNALTESLHTSEERLRFALKNSHTGLWEMNLRDKTAFHSAEHAAIFGYPEVQPDWSYAKFLEHVLPDDRPRADAYVREAEEINGEWNFECRIRRVDGKVRWISVAGRHLCDDAGTPFRAGGIVQDITNRKLAEEELQQLNEDLGKRVAERTASLSHANELLRRANEEWLNTFNASSDPIFLLDTDHHIMRANRATADLLGLQVEDVIGRTCHEIIHECDAPATLCPQCLLLADKRSHTAEVYLEKRGTYLLATVSPIFDAAGDLSGSIHYAKDITAIKEAEETLAHANIELERKVAERTAELAQANEQMKKVSFELIWAEEKERERIAAELHDRVGQSLLLAKMKLDELEDRLPDDSLQTHAVVASSLIDSSIQDIRSLTFRMRPPLLDTAGIATSLEWLCSSVSSDYKLQVEFSDDGLPKPLSAETRYSLYQAVRELLINVAKHAGTHTAQLSMTSGDRTLVVHVADNGAGFDQPDALMKHVNNGGYGLYNVRQRIEQMGGHFIVESAPGNGTTVTLIVPLAES